MNISFDIDDFNINNVYFLDTKKNIIMDGNFTKIIYSELSITLNSIYIQFPIYKHNFNKVHNKNIINFSLLNPANNNIIKELNRIEHDIIEYFKIYYKNNKNNVYSLKSQLKTGNVKIYCENSGQTPLSLTNNIINPRYIIKISGIWENMNSIGITYKILEGFELG